MRNAALLTSLALSLAACASDTDDYSQDDEAFAAEAGGKADAPSFAGLYVTHAAHHYNGDVTALELRGDMKYVRERCYHASCALSVPETDTYDTYTSSAGKTYVRFWSFDVGQDSNGERTEEPTVADVYEVQKTSYGVRLRKSYTTRWFALYRATPASTCTGSGGAWNGTDTCTCAGNTPGAWPAFVFVPGAGGCIATPGASEDACDSSNGFWTDDDATLIDSYCRCGLDRYDGPTGACTDI